MTFQDFTNSQKNINEAWQKTLSLLETSIPSPTFNVHIKTLSVTLQTDESIALIAANDLSKEIISSSHLKAIKEIFQKILGYNANIILKVSDINQKTTTLVTSQKTTKKKNSYLDSLSLPLKPEYCFEIFIVGAHNRLANACALAVTEKLGKTYNPLFIYGDSGLGKTHLMQAIGNRILELNPDAKIFCTTGEAFTSLYVDATRENKIPDLRKKLRNFDLFLLDDIQFLIGKNSTTEEFFHTFNTLYDTGKQIVLTSDRSPKNLDMDVRLLSRFEQGMFIDIKKPDLETRMAILKEKANREYMHFSDDVIEYIAKLIKDNIRQLQGALTKLMAQASLLNENITVEFARETLEKYYRDNTTSIIDVYTIQEKTAHFYNITIDDIVGQSRTKDIVIARQAAMYLTKELTDLSYPSIGKAFGDRDHTTVIHSCKKIEEKLQQEPEYRSTLNHISSKIVE